MEILDSFLHAILCIDYVTLDISPAVDQCIGGAACVYPLIHSWRGGSRARPASVEHVPCEQSYYVYATAEIDCLAQGPKYLLSSYNRL